MLAPIAVLLVAPSDAVKLPDTTGKTVQVLPSTAHKGVVAFFVLSGCPNADAYVPEMNRIAAEYQPKGWKFYLVYADSLYSPHQLAEHSMAFGYTFPSLIGPGKFGRRAGVTKSPEAAVFSSSGTLLYHGRIDDRFYALGKARSTPRVRDLRVTLDALSRGKPAPRASTEVIGCLLPLD